MTNAQLAAMSTEADRLLAENGCTVDPSTTLRGKWYFLALHGLLSRNRNLYDYAKAQHAASVDR